MTVRQYHSAQILSTDGSGAFAPEYSPNVLKRGLAVSALVHSSGTGIDGICQLGVACIGREGFFAVSFIFSSGLHSWVVVNELAERDNSWSVCSPPIIVPLDECVRPVATIHICRDDCIVNLQLIRVTHSETLLDGGRFNIVARWRGYPPHFG